MFAITTIGLLWLVFAVVGFVPDGIDRNLFFGCAWATLVVGMFGEALLKRLGR